MSKPNEEGLMTSVEEVVVLNKFEGNLTEAQMAVTQPIETVKLVNGRVVEHIKWKEVNK